MNYKKIILNINKRAGIYSCNCATVLAAKLWNENDQQNQIKLKKSGFAYTIIIEMLYT